MSTLEKEPTEAAHETTTDDLTQDQFVQKLLELEADPAFQRLKKNLSKTNFFRILGTADTERVHSSFWAWIFDPDGSHGLKDFAARRLLTLATDEDGEIADRLGRKEGVDDIEWSPRRTTKYGRMSLRLSDAISFRSQSAAAAPSTVTGYSEIGIDFSDRSDIKKHRGFMDILILLQGDEPGDDHRNEYITLLVGIECKVEADYDSEQLQTYSQWIHKNPRPKDLTDPGFKKRATTIMNRISKSYGPLFTLGFFLAKHRPEKGSRRNQPAPEELGSPWTSITYGDLIEYVLLPMLTHPRLESTSKALIEQYIDLAGSPNNDILSGTTAANRKLVSEIFQHHETTFQQIAETKKSTKTIVEEFLSRHPDTMWVVAETLEDGKVTGATLKEGQVEEIGNVIYEYLRWKKLKMTNLASSSNRSPSYLVAAGIIEKDTKLKHNPPTKQDLGKKPFQGPVVAEIVPPEAEQSGKSSLKWVEGGGVEIDGTHSASGLLRKIYKERGTEFTDSGNRAWKLASGPYKGKSLKEVYDEVLDE